MPKLFKANVLKMNNRGGNLVECPYCGYKGDFKGRKSWSFGFYEVERLEHLKRHGIFQLILWSKLLGQDIGI